MIYFLIKVTISLPNSLFDVPSSNSLLFETVVCPVIFFYLFGLCCFFVLCCCFLVWFKSWETFDTVCDTTEHIWDRRNVSYNEEEIFVQPFLTDITETVYIGKKAKGGSFPHHKKKCLQHGHSYDGSSALIWEIRTLWSPFFMLETFFSNFYCAISRMKL